MSQEIRPGEVQGRAGRTHLLVAVHSRVAVAMRVDREDQGDHNVAAVVLAWTKVEAHAPRDAAQKGASDLTMFVLVVRAVTLFHGPGPSPSPSHDLVRCALCLAYLSFAPQRACDLCPVVLAPAPFLLVLLPYIHALGIRAPARPPLYDVVLRRAWAGAVHAQDCTPQAPGVLLRAVHT